MQLEIDVPDSAFSALRVSPADFVREMQLGAAIKWYEVGMISQAKAASVAGVSREAFLSAIGRFKVSASQVTLEELSEGVRGETERNAVSSSISQEAGPNPTLQTSFSKA